MRENESEGRLYQYGDVAAAEDDGLRRDSLDFGGCEEACACDMPGAMSMSAKLQKTITVSAYVEKESQKVPPAQNNL